MPTNDPRAQIAHPSQIEPQCSGPRTDARDCPLHGPRIYGKQTAPTGETLADRKEALAELFFQCARYERPSTDWKAALDEYTGTLERELAETLAAIGAVVDERDKLRRELSAATARLSALQSEKEAAVLAESWQPIDTAPKDGTLVQLLIYPDEERCCPLEDSAEPTRTVGHNNFTNDGEDVWLFAGWNWEQDHYTQGEGNPCMWRSMPAIHQSARTQPAGGEKA